MTGDSWLRRYVTCLKRNNALQNAGSEIASKSLNDQKYQRKYESYMDFYSASEFGLTTLEKYDTSFQLGLDDTLLIKTLVLG